MSNKYYHNDYKKKMGVDETRTASEKLLDKAIGGFKPAPSTTDRVVEKKIKQENINLRHIDVLNKLIKLIQNNKNAVKVIKPLNIWRKCLNDDTFISNQEINRLEQWKIMVGVGVEVDQKLLGNYSEVGLVIESLVEIFPILIKSLNRIQNELLSVKEESLQVKQQQGEQDRGKKLVQINQTLSICEIHLIYLKLYTDDSFIFNKLLSDFKAKFFSYFQLKLNNSTQSTPHLYAYLQRLLSKLFSLPHNKYEWIKQSLGQFFKEFNIRYKHLLLQEHQYLKTYNQYLAQKIGKGQGESVNIFGNAGKGGKVTSVEVVATDSLDKWTSKQ